MKTKTNNKEEIQRADQTFLQRFLGNRERTCEHMETQISKTCRALDRVSVPALERENSEVKGDGEPREGNAEPQTVKSNRNKQLKEAKTLSNS